MLYTDESSSESNESDDDPNYGSGRRDANWSHRSNKTKKKKLKKMRKMKLLSRSVRKMLAKIKIRRLLLKHNNIEKNIRFLIYASSTNQLAITSFLFTNFVEILQIIYMQYTRLADTFSQLR